MEQLREILLKFKDKKIVVIGDAMLDKYIYGDVFRISPEAPVPILKVEREFYELGGAGNAASNISALGGKAILFSFIGKDAEGEIIKKLLKEREIDYYLDNNFKTILKIRLIGRNQQFVRLDYEEVSLKVFNSETKEKLKKEAKNADLILISDYAKGAITQDLINLLQEHKKKMIVDPKPKNKNLYKEFFLITPNEKEAFEMSQENEVYKAGRKLRNELQTNVLITRGKDGMTLFSDKEMNIPIVAKEVYDVTGAGDTVISTLALAIATGSSLEEAAIIANHAAGIAVSKTGTYQVKINELYKALSEENSKIKQIDELISIVSDLKRKGKKIVWTSGCFDLLHIGHIKSLQESKKLADILIVGLNSDSSARKLKGDNRPINSENERAEILTSLELVDYIIIFPETSAEDYLKKLKPDFYAKGEDYTLETINQTERKIIESYSGKIVFIPFIGGKSTSKIIEKIKNGK